MPVRHTEIQEKVPKWLDQLNFGSKNIRFESCWCRSDDSNPTFVRALPGRCSRLIANPEFFEQHSGFQQYFAQVCEWTGCSGNRQEIRQTSVSFLGPRILDNTQQYLIRRVGSHRSFFKIITSGIPTQFMKLNWSQHKRWVQHAIKHSVMLFVTSETFQMYCRSRWARSNDLL